LVRSLLLLKWAAVLPLHQVLQLLLLLLLLLFLPCAVLCDRGLTALLVTEVGARGALGPALWPLLLLRLLLLRLLLEQRVGKVVAGAFVRLAAL
jgi:hypothetical protein